MNRLIVGGTVIKFNNDYSVAFDLLYQKNAICPNKIKTFFIENI